MTDQDRVTREKQWHNETHGSDIRGVVGKYYATLSKLSDDMNVLIEGLLNVQSTVLLDYGCGTGTRLLKYAKDIHSGIGIDISDASIEEAISMKERDGLANIDFAVMDAMNMTFEDKTFDVVIGTAILHHLEMKPALLEIKRVLGKMGGGVAVFNEPLGTNPLINTYRKVTPQMRTSDEQPLRRQDIALIKEIFPKTNIRYYSFLTLLAVPFRNRRCFKGMLKILASIDAVILRTKSPFKWFAWYCLIEMKT
jgi:SAM-dependent methyltransferase